MRISAAHIQGFKSFKDETTFEFPRNRGLYFVFGINKSDKELGANGAGKSTVFDAICWALFGKTSRGTKGPSLVNRGGEHLCQVVVDLESVFIPGSGLGSVIVRRSQNPNSLSIETAGGDRRKVVQKDVEDLLGFGYDAFLSTCLFGQFSPWFLDRTSGDRLKILEDALDLSVYDRAATLAGKRLKDAETVLADCDQRASRYRGRLEASKKLLENEKDRRDSWDRIRKKSLSTALVAVEEAESILASAEEDYETVEKAHSRAKKKVDELRTKLASRSVKAQRFSDQLAEITNLCRGAETDHEFLSKQIDSYPSEGKCPTCYSVPKKADVRRILKDLKARAKGSENDLGVYREDLRRKQEEIAEFKADVRDLMQFAKEKETELEKLSKRLGAAMREKVDAKKSLASARKSVKDSKKTKNPFRESVRELIADRKKDRISLREIKEERTKVSEIAETYKFWKSGMKDLRLIVVEDALRELEIHTNSCLVGLGLRKFKISFEVERAGAGNKIVRGFSTFITGPDCEEPVPFELWSGGETQRLRIAAALGVSSIVRSRLGIDIPFEVWDEPTTHLSEEGVDDLIRSFADRVRDESRQIWVIDHRSPSSGNWDGFRIIQKTRYGSSILARERL